MSGFPQLDLSQPLEEQGQLDVIIHKLTDLILEADQNDSQAMLLVQRVQVCIFPLMIHEQYRYTAPEIYESSFVLQACIITRYQLNMTICGNKLLNYIYPLILLLGRDIHCINRNKIGVIGVNF